MNSPITYKEIRDIVYGKLVDKTITEDYDELSERLFGEGNCFARDEVRKRIYGMKAVIDAIEREPKAIENEGSITALEQKRIELQKERQKFFDQRNALNKVIRERSRQEELNEIIERCITDGNLPVLDSSRQCVYYEPTSNDLLVSLNDIHYGAVVDNAWRKYNSDICADMMDRYLDEVLKIANLHECENCIVWCAGDNISGNIHRSIQVTNKENVIEQITGVSELIAEFIAKLAENFASVRFISVAGNHSRLDPNKENALTDERLDDLVEWYLKARLQDYKNVVIDASHKMDCTMSVFDVRGKNYALIHGDYDGSPSSVQSLQTMAQKPLYAVLSGHKHHNMMNNVQGIITIMAGSFLGMDDFCVQKRIYGKPEQMICVCDDSGIRCSYNIDLS